MLQVWEEVELPQESSIGTSNFCKFFIPGHNKKQTRTHFSHVFGKNIHKTQELYMHIDLKTGMTV